MSGRAYTMKEMKGIVDYLVENKCFDEYRGRKMWVDYANSDKTSRTWQSLKETFLKRILPDIHNPYYKLHLDEIRSFRVGEDVTGKPKNKLEFQTASDDTSNVQEKASTSQNESNEASKGPGEKIQQIASSNRESVETIILGSDEAVATPTKISLRDRIQYADEPVVHIIRNILHDFSATDEEQTGNHDEKSNKATKDTTPSKHKGSNNEEKKESPSKKSLRLKKKENKNENITTKEDTVKKIVTRNRNQTVTSPNNNVTVGRQDISADDQSTTNASHSMPDSLLPNNPEALKDKNSTRISNETVEQPNSKKKSADSSTKVTRKRIREPTVSSDSVLAGPPINHTGNPKKEAPPKPKKNEPIDEVVVTTIMVNESEELHTDENKTTNLSSQQSPNPCLQSVSLFAEQFLEANSDSDTDINTNSKNSSHSKDLAEKSPTLLKPVATIDKKVATKDVVVLESHSESASDDNTQPAKQELPRATKTQSSGNSNLINNLFGSTSGGVKRNRHRTSSHRNRVNRHYVQSSDSSEWTSESDSEGFVSPPRSRNRLAKKYLKPQSSRILSLEEDGGLFVVCGKKVFPLVKDGKSVGTHLTYLPERDSDEEKDSYWQLKYVEERKKTTELTKLLQNIKQHGEINQTRSRKSVAVDSPILQSIPSKNHKSIVIDDNSSDLEEVKEQALAIPSAPKETEEEKTVKIKFAKDNEEVQLEGHWRSLHPILGDVMQMFKKQETARAPSPSTLADKTEAEDVHKKVDELEAKIFKEIEERDAKERLHRNEETEKNITESRRKRGRTKGSTTPTEPAARASKRLKGSTESSGSEVLVVEETKTRRSRNKLSEDNANSTTSKDDTPMLPKRKSNTKLKPNDETPTAQGRKSITKQLTINMNGITPQGRKSTEGLEKNAETSPRQLRKSTQKDLKENGVASAKDDNEALHEKDGSPDENEASIIKGEAAINEDSQILYKFPSPVTEKKSVGNPKKHKKYFRRTPNIFSSPENISHQSSDSSQGYQDSDNSPLSGRFRRKKKFSLPTNLYKSRKYNRFQRRKTLIHIECDASSESSNTSFGIPARSITIQNSSLTSDVYRSESYQLLMPLARSFRPLEKISESSPCPNVVDSQHNSLDLSPASQNMESCTLGSHSNDIEVGNSSNVTLPMSPELSIVENISAAKDTLSGNFPTINETQKNCGGTYDNQYDISEVDVSVPLMEQDCTFRMNYQKRQSVSRLSVDMHTQQPDSTDIDLTETIPATSTGVTVSQSLLEKIDTVSIEAQTTTDSLDTQLGNLLLESAKKIALQNKIIVDAQSQQTDHDKEEPAALKPKTKCTNRCSTPHKRKVPKKSQLPTNPVIEEQMEFCTSGRKSCPPVISVFCPENPTVDPNSGKTAPVPTIATRKPRRAKEIIKVKIIRPKRIKQGKKNRSTLSVQTDSGINDTTASGILHSFNSSVELIHNHSETCLHAQECMHCSVEFVENTPQSIISLDSSSKHSVESDKENLPNVGGNKSLCAQFFSTDAQDASCLTIGSGMTSRSSGAAHVSGTSMNSLMTEDLSPPPAPSRSPSSWRLLSEDEDSLSRDPLAPAACSVADGDPTSDAITNHFGDSTDCAKTNNFDDPTGCANTVGYGSNLRQLFPIACAVPDLSTITEQSRETDCNSLGFKMDTNTRNEFLALNNLMEGNQEEFFTCPSDI